MACSRPCRRPARRGRNMAYRDYQLSTSMVCGSARLVDAVGAHLGTPSHAKAAGRPRSRHRVGGVIDEDFQVLVAGVGVPMVRPVRPPGGPPAATVRDPPWLLVILVEQCPGMAGDIPDPSGRHPARDVEPAEAPAAEHRVHRRAGSPEERSQAVGPVPPGGSRGEDLSDDRLRQPARRAMRAARPVLEPRDSICSCGGPRGDDGPS